MVMLIYKRMYVPLFECEELWTIVCFGFHHGLREKERLEKRGKMRRKDKKREGIREGKIRKERENEKER